MAVWGVVYVGWFSLILAENRSPFIFLDSKLFYEVY